MKKGLLILVIFILIFSACSKKTQKDEINTEISAVIDYVEGTVLINNETANIGDIVPVGANIKTEQNSLCEIVFNQKNIIRIMENSELNLSIAKNIGSVDLKQGSIAALLTKLETLALKDTFNINSQSVTAGVRGTAFFIKAEDENNTYICTCYGSLELETANKSEKKQTEYYHHGAYRFTKSGEDISINEAKLLYHDDASMEDLAGKIDEKISWGKYNY